LKENFYRAFADMYYN